MKEKTLEKSQNEKKISARKALPKAKKKVKIAEKIFPRIAERAKLKASFTLSTKFPTTDKEGGDNPEG